jgi:hypothetical protein
MILLLVLVIWALMMGGLCINKRLYVLAVLFGALAAGGMFYVLPWIAGGGV